MKKKNTWIKVVIAIIILELVVGGIIFAYRKLNAGVDNSISTDDKEVVDLYKKIAYYDIESLDVMSPRIMLYYAYKNSDITESINCEVVNTTDDTSGYSCDGIASFVSYDTLSSEVKDIYGPNVNVEAVSFEIDPNHYAFYDEEMAGYAIYTKDEEVSVDPVNLNLADATLDDDENIILTVEILNGIYGTVEDTYNFTFTKDGDNYYLTSKQLVTS